MLKPVPSPVDEALILICEKCGKKLESDPEKNPSRAIQLSLKEKIKTEGEKGRLRAVLTTCMDICPEKQVAVGIVRPEREQEAQFFTLEEEDFENAADLIFKEARGAK